MTPPRDESVSAIWLCPHCGLDHTTGPKMCPDTGRWTREEKDRWREQARKRDPGIRSTPTFISGSLPQVPR